MRHEKVKVGAAVVIDGKPRQLGEVEDASSPLIRVRILDFKTDSRTELVKTDKAVSVEPRHLWPASALSRDDEGNWRRWVLESFPETH